MTRTLVFTCLFMLSAAALGCEAKLDMGKRAQLKGWAYPQATTLAHLRKIRLQYRSDDFDAWSRKLRSLRSGMLLDEVQRILNAREVRQGYLTTGAGRVDFFVLDDAYYTGVMVEPESRRMIWATPPIAITFVVEATQKQCEDSY